MDMPCKEIGYNYSVSFTIDAKNEAKGTELFRSSNAVFYLSDPRNGQLGFARDGYLNTFNYRLPEGRKVTITIQGDNRKTELFVDGKKIQSLDPLTLYAVHESDKVDFFYGVEHPQKPELYNPRARMNYQRTLVFPLEKAGDFKSTVTDLKVYNYFKL